MRFRWYLRTLLVLAAVALLPAMTALATHEPTAEEVVAVAVSSGMQCPQAPGQPDCTGYSGDFPRYAYIAPDSGPLDEVATEAYAFFNSNSGLWYMQQADRDWMVSLQSVGCVDSAAVGSFIDEMVAAIGDPQSGTTTYGPKTVGECSMLGNLGTGTQRAPFWSVTGTALPSAFSPTPSPTPTATAVPTATPKPTAVPTARPTARPTVRPTAVPATVTPTPTAEQTVAGIVFTPKASPSPTAEQTVAGIAFTPEPSGGPAAGNLSGWAASVPAVGDVSTDPATLASSAMAALLLLLAMGFIGELFNNTFTTNYDRIIGGWRKSRLGRIARAFSGLWGGNS